MARTEINPVQLTNAGVAPGAGNVGTVDGHMVRLDGNEVVEFTNSHASPQVVTIVTPKAPSGLAVADRTVTVPGAGGRMLVADLNPGLFGQIFSSADAGKAYINYPAGVEAQINTRVYRT